MEQAIKKLQAHKRELQKFINDGIKNQKTMRVVVGTQEMIGIKIAIKVLKDELKKQ